GSNRVVAEGRARPRGKAHAAQLHGGCEIGTVDGFHADLEVHVPSGAHFALRRWSECDPEIRWPAALEGDAHVVDEHSSGVASAVLVNAEDNLDRLSSELAQAECALQIRLGVVCDAH